MLCQAIMPMTAVTVVGFVAVVVVGSVCGIVMAVDIVGVMRDLDIVFFEATVSTLATVMALVPGGTPRPLVVVLVVTDGLKVINHCPSSAGSLGH